MNNLLFSKRFRRLKSKDEVFNLLNIVKNKKSGVFKNLQETFTFCVSLGVKYNKILPINGASGEPIAYDLFSSEQQKYFDSVVLFHDIENIENLDKNNSKSVENYLSIIESYANAGIEILEEQIKVHPEDTFNIVSRLIDEQLRTIVPKEVDEDFEW